MTAGPDSGGPEGPRPQRRPPLPLTGEAVAAAHGRGELDRDGALALLDALQAAGRARLGWLAELLQTFGSDVERLS